MRYDRAAPPGDKNNHIIECHREISALGVRDFMTSPPPQTPPRTVYLNGDYLPEDQAKISIFDRGFLMADAIYEVVAVIDGELIDFSPHIARLTRSLREVDFDYPIDEQELHNIMSALISRNQLKNGRVYFQITRGNPGDRDFVYDKTTAPLLCCSRKQRMVLMTIKPPHRVGR